MGVVTLGRDYPNWYSRGLSVNLSKTASNVKDFFKYEYPRICRLAGVNPASIKSPSIDDMPKGNGFGNANEERVIQHLSRIEELKTILKAIRYWDTTSQFILIEDMIQHKSNDVVSEELGYMASRYANLKSHALQVFADSYEGVAGVDLHSYSMDKLKS